MPLLGGLPFVRYSITENISHDLIILLPVALLLMVLMLYFSFREWKGVFLPFIVVIMSMIVSFGVMALLGWQISLITILLPIMLIAIANNYGIHMIALYQELAQRDQIPVHHNLQRTSSQTPIEERVGTSWDLPSGINFGGNLRAFSTTSST